MTRRRRFGLDKQLTQVEQPRRPTGRAGHATRARLQRNRDGLVKKLKQHPIMASGEKYLTRAYETWEQDTGIKLNLWPFVRKPKQNRLDMSYNQKKDLDLSHEARKRLQRDRDRALLGGQRAIA
jgi:hypothetical protein